MPTQAWAWQPTMAHDMDQSQKFIPWSWRALIGPCVLLLLAAAVLPLDLPVARWCLAENCPGGVRKLFGLCEGFGHGLGVLVILALIYQLDPGRRWALPRVAACALGCGLTANLLKLIVARTRPLHAASAADVWSTFGTWLPWTSGGFGGQSFPSAHTATAFGLAAALVWLYPRGRVLFPLLAVLVAAQRIDSGAHFPSDVFVGAAVGALVAPLFLRYGHLPALLSRCEARWRPTDPAIAAHRRDESVEASIAGPSTCESM